MKTVAMWAVVIIVLLWVIKNPAGAAAFVHGIFHALSVIAGSL